MVMAIEDIGRIRLSWSFFMADMLYAPEAAEHGIPNIPDNLDLAVIAGRGLAEQVLEVLVATFGAVRIREGYLSSDLYNRELQLGHFVDAPRVWDRFDEEARVHAGATVVVPWLTDHDRPNEATNAMILLMHSNLRVSEVERRKHLGVLRIVWCQGAAPDPSQTDPVLFASLGFPSLRVPRAARRYEILPPV